VRTLAEDFMTIQSSNTSQSQRPPDAKTTEGSAQEAPSRKALVLIVEDDRDLNNLLKYTLEATGDYTVRSHFEGAQACALMVELKPDLVILDVMLPGLYGTDVLKQLRSEADLAVTPVILLTARSQESDKIEGFESGADDYITKPFSPRELLLRVQALLRRSAPSKAAQTPSAVALGDSPEKSILVGPLTIFPEQYKVLVTGEHVQLTATEYQLLVYLAERVGRLQSREALLQRVWGYEGNVNTRTVDTHIKRLRQKLGFAGQLIETVHGFGYQLTLTSQTKRRAGAGNEEEPNTAT
jgi:two-component system, OmpR family, phosphate regulon response regulator PhoB